MKKRIVSALLALMVLCFAAMAVYALEVPDLSRTGSIHVALTYEGESVPGGSITLYRVAEIAVENQSDFSFRYVDSYADCGVDLSDLHSAETAAGLARFTGENAIQGLTGTIGSNGTITFTELELGLYLLVQNTPAPGYNPITPFLVAVPNYTGDSYEYDVNASPKVDLEPAPTEPTEPESTEPEPTVPDELPQTGQNNWPVPVLAVVGLIFLAMGAWLCVSGRKRRVEE